MLAIDLVGGLAKDNVLTKLVDPGPQLHTTYCLNLSRRLGAPRKLPSEVCIEDHDVEVRTSAVRTLLAICPEGNKVRSYGEDAFTYSM